MHCINESSFCIAPLPRCMHLREDDKQILLLFSARVKLNPEPRIAYLSFAATEKRELRSPEAATLIHLTNLGSLPLFAALHLQNTSRKTLLPAPETGRNIVPEHHQLRI